MYGKPGKSAEIRIAPMNSATHFFERGWCQYPYDSELHAWVERALPAARRTLTDPEFARWLRYQGTWFAGVNALYKAARPKIEEVLVKISRWLAKGVYCC